MSPLRRERAGAGTLVLRGTATGSDTRDRAKALDELVTAVPAGVCDEAAVRRLYTLGPEAAALAPLAAARRIAEQDARPALLETQAREAGGVGLCTPSGLRLRDSQPHVAADRRPRLRARRAARSGSAG